MALEGAPFKLCYRRDSSIGHRNTGAQVDRMKLADRWGLSTVEVWFPRKKTPAQAELGRGTPASLFSIA
jgi:hypothetical protein